MDDEERLSRLAAEVNEWERGVFAEKKGFQTEPEAAPRVSESTLISIRIPKGLLRLLKAAAKEQGIGYQVLMQRWLEDRLKQEYETRKADQKRQTEVAPVRAGEVPSGESSRRLNGNCLTNSFPNMDFAGSPVPTADRLNLVAPQVPCL